MAFNTITALRTGKLNVELGLAADGDDDFFSTAVRDAALTDALRRLWPIMARLQRETVTVTANTREYTLSTLREVELIERIDATYTWVVGDLAGNWFHYLDEAAEPATSRLQLGMTLDTGTVLRAIGWTPYAAPTSGSIDLPPHLEHIVIDGAVAALYRAKLNQFMDYERFQNESRTTNITVDQLLAIINRREGAYERGKELNRRRLVIPTRGSVTRR